MADLVWDNEEFTGHLADDIDMNEVRFLREAMPGEEGYVAPPTPTEPAVHPRKGLKVRELIAKLSEMDPELFVITSDCCYGYEGDVEVDLETLKYSVPYDLKRAGVKEGDTVVLIN